jgi:hypothetical protein
VAAGAALAFAGYSALHRDDAGNRELRQALTLLDEPGKTKPAVRLLQEAGKSASPRIRGQADNLLASILYELRGGNATAQSMRLYAEAIRLDPTDDASKFDLELLATLGGAKQHGRSSGRAHGKKTSKLPAHEQPGGGAGATAGGSGY